MNCESFGILVVDLARDGLLEAGSRSSGLEHAESCTNCSLRLENEREISSALRNLAVSDQNLQATPALEATLMAAFRSRDVAIVAPFEVTTKLPASRRYHWSAAIAAAVLTAVVSAGAVKWIIGGHGAQPAGPQVSSGSSTNGLGVKPDIKTPPAVDDPPNSKGGSDNVAGVDALGKEIAPRSRPKFVPREASYSPEARPAQKDIAAKDEIMTEFMPVSYSSSLTPVESGHVVRVELPRTVLESYGLATNGNDTTGRVKADVLIDEFGTARAIRFVR